MRRNWPFFKDSDWLILVFVHSAKPTAELENLAMSPSLSSAFLRYQICAYWSGIAFVISRGHNFGRSI